MDKKQYENDITEKEEGDSMKTSTIGCVGYKRLNFNSLNMTSEKTEDKSVENITPVKWSKEVLSGERQIVIKKK